MIVKHPREYVVDKLQYALNPKTIAVVGASRYSTKVGYKVVDGLLTWGYKGKIYPVNPRADKVAGFTAYKTVKDIPDEIDLAFLAVPAHIVQSVLRACAAAQLARMLLDGVGLMDLVELPPLAQMETGDASASPVFVAVNLGQ